MMKENKHRTYTQEEINEIENWFKEQTLPTSMHLDKSTFIPNVSETLISLLEQSYICRENPKMLGCIRLLERIKAKLEEGMSENK